MTMAEERLPVTVQFGEAREYADRAYPAAGMIRLVLNVKDYPDVWLTRGQARELAARLHCAADATEYVAPRLQVVHGPDELA